MASVTLGSSSPTYKLAEGDVPDPAAGALLNSEGSSPSAGEGDSLGDGAVLDSPLGSEGAASEDTVSGLSSFVGVATGEVSALEEDIFCIAFGILEVLELVIWGFLKLF
jgi:hypothetical protein